MVGSLVSSRLSLSLLSFFPCSLSFLSSLSAFIFLLVGGKGERGTTLMNCANKDRLNAILSPYFHLVSPSQKQGCLVFVVMMMYVKGFFP